MQAHHASFLPQILVRHARNGMLQTGEGAFSLLRPGVLLFTDISGFTALTERFAAGNALAGAEQLTDLLNNYFDPLICTVHSHGGDIIKFAGDAMLILWVADETHTMRMLADNAIACAHALQRVMMDVATRRGETLAMKAAVSAGDIRQVCLGGVLGRRDMLLTGSALSELGRANDFAKPGDTIVCGSAVRLFETPPPGGPLVEPGSDDAGDAAQAILSDASAYPVAPARQVVPGSNTGIVADVSTDATDVLRTFIPAAIRKALDANQADWVSENRLVSLLFVNLRDFSDELPVDFEQTAMRAIQTALYQFEGSLNKISVDDKGVSLLGAFGMPPFRHTDDPLRAVRAALAIHASLTALNLRCAIGVTTGRVFCGVVGNNIRREYTVMGDVVNLSARLMGNALKRKSGLPIMVDERTWQATHDKLPFGPVEHLTLKGKAHPVPAYQPLERTKEGANSNARPADTRPLLGRDSERAGLREAARSVLTSNRSMLVDVAGPLGSGRRHLTRAAMDDLSGEGFMIWRMTCSAMQQYSPWQAFAPVIRGLLPHRERDEPMQDWCARIAQSLPQEAWWQDRLPLLEAVMSAQWTETPVSAALSGEARATATGEFLSHVLAHRIGSQPVCIRIRDVEWMDRASVALCRRLLSGVPHLLFVAIRDSEFSQAGFWPDVDSWPEGQCRSMNLPPLPAETLLSIAKDQLGFANPPAESLRLLDERAGGSPLHAIQILSAIQQAGDDFNIDELPASIEGLIVSRIDRLPPETALTGKILSVAILDMAFATLHTLHPSRPHATGLAEHCTTLTAQGFVRAQGLDPDAQRGLLQFAHPSAQQTFYSLLPVAQRRALHHRMAQSLESRGPEASDLIDHRAYHWLKACETLFGASAEELGESVLGACATLLEQARRNTRLGTLLEAEQQFQHVIELGKTHRLPATRDLEIDALLGLSSVRFSRFGWADEQAAVALESARSLCSGSGKRLPVFSAMRGLWQIRTGRSQYDQSLQLAQEMIEFAQQTDVSDDSRDAMRAEAHRALGTTFFWLGRFAEAESFLRKTLDIPDAAPAGGLNLTQDTRVTTLGMLGWALAIQGKFDDTRIIAQEAVVQAQRCGGAFSLAYVHGTAMWAFLHLSDVDNARHHAGETLNISQAKGFEYLATAARVVFGWAKVWQGDAQGETEIANAIDAWRNKGQTIGMPAFLLQHVRVLRRLGRQAEADALLASETFQKGLQTEPWIGLLTRRMLNE